jgi:Tfp pilus assembly protein PilF
MDGKQHRELGELWLDQGNVAGAVREFAAVVAHDPIDPAEAHYNLARAYNLQHQTEKAKDELFAALEAAPGYKPALKLYLELNGPEKETPEAPVKK